MNLCRTRDKIHTRECRYAQLVWVWAEPLSSEEIQAAMRANGLTECCTCKPFKGSRADA